MSTSPRSHRLRRATAIVPLALISAAWTVTAVGGSGTVATLDSATTRTADGLPGGGSVPAAAVEVPASVSTNGDIAPGLARGSHSHIVSTAYTAGIPAAALAAYQRAETVIDAADTSCHLSWQLIAAIGRVESDHGRADGNALNDKGIDHPGIFGPVLDGKHGTSLIRDSDGGEYDRNTSFDRAVGPMQFIPSTWSVVGVDADGDGRRDPQDINDAALGTAVYLCSGPGDLATTAGQKAAVYRYNHSASYVALVLSVMRGYLAGDFTSAPNGVSDAGIFLSGATSAPPPPGGHPRGCLHLGPQRRLGRRLLRAGRHLRAPRRRQAPPPRRLAARHRRPRGDGDRDAHPLDRTDTHDRPVPDRWPDLGPDAHADPRWRRWRPRPAALDRRHPAAAPEHLGHPDRPAAHPGAGDRAVHARRLRRQPAQDRRPLRPVRAGLHRRRLTEAPQALTPPIDHRLVDAAGRPRPPGGRAERPATAER